MTENEDRDRQEPVASDASAEVSADRNDEDQTAHPSQRPGNHDARVTHLLDVDSGGIRCLGVFPARAQPKTEACFIEDKRSGHQDEDPDVRRDVRVLKQKLTDDGDIPQQRHLQDTEIVIEGDLRKTLRHPGDVDRERRREQVQRRTGDGLVRFHVDGSVGMQERENQPAERRDDQCDYIQRLRGNFPFEGVDEEDAEESAHDHDSFQRDVDDAAALGEHAAQGYDDQWDDE